MNPKERTVLIMNNKKQYIMAIDHGTTSTRAILFDHDCRIAGIAQKEGGVDYPHPGWVEQDAVSIWLDTLAVMAGVLNKAGIDPDQVAAIGISNQRETSVLWDKKPGFPFTKPSSGSPGKPRTFAMSGKNKGWKTWFAKKPDCASTRTSRLRKSPGCWSMCLAPARKRKTAS